MLKPRASAAEVREGRAAAEEEEEVVEPERSIEAAAEVVEAIAVAETGSGWLWVPS